MRYLLVFLVPLSLVLGQTPKIDPNAQTGYSSITPSDLRAHLTFLSSGELEGRETSYRGQKVAAQYIAAVFAKLGLKPLGDSGTYFQHFKVNITRPSKLTTLSLTDKMGTTTFVQGKDFLSTIARDTTLTGPIVFIGYQDTPLDKEKEQLLEGKIVLTLMGRRGDARKPKTERRQPYFRLFRGSIATFIITDESVYDSLGQQAKQLYNFLEKGSMSLVGDESRTPSFPRSILLSSETGEALLSSTGKPLSDFREAAYRDSLHKPIVIASARVTINLKSETKISQSENVIGMLEGSDPVVKNEYVLFTAHYDHLGVGADGSIYHGADDDGSGTSAVLEMAEAFVLNPERPRRSVLFMTVAGEEKGLLGSRYYVTHPILPLDKTIADLNIDMIGRVDRHYEELNNPNYVYVIGSDKISTELDSLLNVANGESEQLLLDYKYNDDNDPNRFYRRSDHYNFARNGVPIVFFFTGAHADYHRPTDTVDKINFDKYAKIARLVYYTGWKVANFKRLLIKNGGISSYN